MVEITALESNLDLIQFGQKKIYLVGTAHISQASVNLVRRTIREVKPASVAIELCQPRYQSLRNPDRWKNMDLFSVIRSGKGYLLMAQLALVAFQKRLGERLNIRPGAEMLAAADLAQEVSAQVVMADRDVTLTLKRTWGALGFWTMTKLFFSSLFHLFGDEKIDEAEIERLKTSDALNELMREFSESLPEVRTTLIDERDKYLAGKIQTAPGDTVVAVVGAGHCPGIKGWIGKDVDFAELERLPEPRFALRFIGWLVPVAAVGLILYGLFVGGASTSANMLWQWIWITGTAAALGALLALGHPLTILSAFIAAPLTTLHPLLASGWIAGLVEAWVRKPRVSDLENVSSDIAHFSGIWRNRVSRILLVMALTNLLGSLGAIYGIKVVASLLGSH